MHLAQILRRTSPDVLVVGGGMAALCAAIAARHVGARVLMAEAAPKALRGGNTRHSRNMRSAHDGPTRFIPDTYPEVDFLADLAKVADGVCDSSLTRLLVRRSDETVDWLADHGVAFQTAFLPYSRKTAFFLGGGKMAINALYAAAERLGVEIAYATPVPDLRLDNPGVRATIVCSGGEQAALPAGFINRGTPFADGKVLRSLLEQGVGEVGAIEAGHLVAVDARFDDHDGGIVTRVDGMEFGMVVDRSGERFQDEAAVRGSTRYSAWGKLVAERLDRWAALVLDAEGVLQAPPSALAPIRAETLEELAVLLGVNGVHLVQAARQSERVFRPPYFALPIRPGVAFTCRGVRVDEKARLVMTDGSFRANAFAAGVIMAPNILGTGYLAGGGLSIGAVFGRIAGEEAARYALG